MSDQDCFQVIHTELFKRKIDQPKMDEPFAKRPDSKNELCQGRNDQFSSYDSHQLEELKRTQKKDRTDEQNKLYNELMRRKRKEEDRIRKSESRKSQSAEKKDEVRVSE